MPAVYLHGMRLINSCFLFLVAVAIPTAATCQVVPADTADVMLGVAESMSARGEREDAEWILLLIQRRYPNSDAAQSAADLLSELRGLNEAGSGNTELVVFNTFYGAALGVIVPAALNADGPEPYGAGILLGAPTGYLLSKWYTKKRPVTTGQARAMTFGTWWGAWQGIGWREVLDIGDRQQTYCYTPIDEGQCFEAAYESDAAPFTATLIGGLSGLAVGTILGRSRPISGSTALITNFSALWGSWFGAVLGVQIDRNDPQDFNNDDDGLLATMLIVGNVGLLAGAVGGSSLQWSTGDAWAVHLSGIVGLIGGLGIDLLASVESTETGLLIPGLTSAATLAVAAALVHDRPSTASSDSSLRPSLIDFASGRWSMGVPAPTPTAIPVYKYGRRHLQPGAQVSLLRMAW